MEGLKPIMQCGFCSTREQCFFNGLSDKESEFLMQNKREIVFKAGETIYKQGTESKYMIFLVNGMAKIMVEGNNGKNFILQLIKPYEFIDFPAIFEDDMLYRTSIAIVDSKACLIDIAAFKHIMLSNKGNVPKLIKHFNQLQRRFSDRIVNVIYKNMEARIAETILYLVNEIYYSRVFRLTISRMELAELSGLSKESTSRILSQFKEQEILKIKGKDFEILDKKYLEQLLRVG
ncbi:MAG: Crp/Fnr family transcriptional regulator [Bacteroidota bacterium]|nr:Crp/Fnr family transcriptional regulator [Bacteroidota bacterium]